MSNVLDCNPCCTTPTNVNIPGPQGQSSFTITSASFVVPPVGNNVTVTVQNTDWIAEGQPIFIEGAGIFSVVTIVDGTHVTLQYTNIPTNVASGNTINAGALVTCACTSTAGADGQNAYTVTTANFTCPAINANVAMAVGNSQWLTVGQNFFVQTAGYFEVISKADATHVTGKYLDVADNTNAGNNILAGAGVSPAGPDLANPLTVSRGGTNGATATVARANLGVGGASVTAYAAGTAYQLTAVSSAITFGTTQPAVTINAVGTWLLLGRVRVDYNGATFAAVRTGTLKFRRTNNTAADLTSGSASFLTDIITTLTYTLEVVNLPPLIYVTTNTNDAITIFGDISVVPSAGSLDCVQAEIVAIKLFDQTV